jgi:hypothetical protein
MTRIEKIIVVVLCLLSLSFLGYMIVSWTSQGSPAAAAPGPEVTAATVTPPLQNAVSPPPTVPAPQAQPSAATQSRPDYFLRAERAVRGSLRDPDSASFGSLFEGRGIVGRVTICGEVNSKNGFGGYTGMTPFVYFPDTDRSEMITTNRNATTDDGLKAYFKDCRTARSRQQE